MLFNLHLLRAIAALGVVYFHTTSTAGLRLPWDVGSRGVDVFFVISGFIIAYIGTSKPQQFFRRRLIRVVPFYWAATLAVFALVLLAPRYFRSTTADATHLLLSLLFMPHQSVTGEMHPTLVLGWSLNFEMFFYVLFAMALLISRRRAPLLCVGALLAFVLTVHAIGTGNEVIGFYARPIVLEFCAGIAVFYLFNWCNAHRDRLARVGALRWGLGAVLLGNLIALVVLEHRHPEVPRYLAAGIPAFLVVASALLLEGIYGLRSRSKVVYLVGEASYIIYLIHPYIVFTVLRVFVKDTTRLSAPVIVGLIVGLMTLVSLIAIAIHLAFEKPAMAFLRRRLAPDRPAAVRLAPG